jgi:class 3 adenylate cyclase
MVASGLPVPNVNHAAISCTMALHLRRVVSGCEIPHLPGEKLWLRIGIHSGKKKAKNIDYRPLSVDDESTSSCFWTL